MNKIPTADSLFSPTVRTSFPYLARKRSSVVFRRSVHYREKIQTKHDDYYYGCLAKQAGIQWQTINKKPKDSNFESIDSVYSVSTKFYINEKNLCNIIKSELGMK